MASRHWLARALIAGEVIGLLWSFAAVQAAFAHGKELSLEVSSFAPDPQEPLVRLYRVLVVYAADGEPVTGAEVRFTAARGGGGPSMEPVVLKPLNEAGVYAAQVTYPIFGAWSVTLEVGELQGNGEAIFVEDLSPAGPARDSGEVRQRVLELFFRFNWWDVAAIAVRVSHSLGAIVWFGPTGLVLATFWILPPSARTHMFRRLEKIFLPATGLSLLVLAASGVYTGIFSAPIKPPGVFDFDVMMSIPFGPQYLAVIGLKAIAMGALMVLAVRMAMALKVVSLPALVGGGSYAAAGDHPALLRQSCAATPESRLFRMAVANAVIGLLLAVAVVLAIYIHYISHLAVFLPE